MKINLGGRDLVLDSASVLKTMDTGADEWNCVTPWIPGDNSKFDEIVAPRSLSESIVSIRGQKLITGNKYRTNPGLSNRSQIGLGGFSKTYSLIKSNPKEQKEFLEASLMDISKELCEPFGFNAKSLNVDTEVNEIFSGNPGQKIAAQAKVFPFLQDLARQRSVLTSSDENGNLLYLRANTSQNTVGTIKEGPDGSPITKDFSASFDDSEAFQNYIAVNDSPYAYLVKDPQGVSKDTRIKVASFKTIIINSLTEGAGQKAADFARNQTLAKGMSIPFSVNSWDDPNGNLWRENTLVTVVSPTLFVPQGFTFLIRAVQYNLDGKGETGVLFLVPPSLYTDGDIEEPWGKGGKIVGLGGF